MRSGSPYHADRFYLIAEYDTSNWVQNIRANPAVRVRVGQNTFPAAARIVSKQTEPELHNLISQLSVDKYGWGDGLTVEIVPQS